MYSRVFLFVCLVFCLFNEKVLDEVQDDSIWTEFNLLGKMLKQIFNAAGKDLLVLK